MQIDTKIDPRWCEALLSMLEGDLNHNRVAEAKSMLRAGIDSIRRIRPDAPAVGSLDGALGSQDKSIRGCLLSKLGRGDCEHAVGLPGKSIPGKHDGSDDTVDEYGRPNGWCEVCWRGWQMKCLEFAFFNFAKQYGGGNFAAETVRLSNKYSHKGSITENEFKELCVVAPSGSNEYTAYIIEAKRLASYPSGTPVYLTLKDGILDKPWLWTSDVNSALQFCRSIDAERYAGKNDGTWKIVEHGFYE